MPDLMVSGAFPCVRVGKIAEEMPHECLSRLYPPQLDDVYLRLRTMRCSTRREFGEAMRGYDIIHVHNEPNWPVSIAKEMTSSVVVMNVHDVTCARKGPLDPDEGAAFEDADAFVFVTAEQRQFCIEAGLPVEGKPYVVLPCYASASTIVEKSRLSHVGGVVYAGGVDAHFLRDPEGNVLGVNPDTYRDLYPLVKTLGKKLHLYPGCSVPQEYQECTLHTSVLEYRLLTQALARHDWGLTGVPDPAPGWLHSFPNKVSEYLMAGIPVIALNNPLIKPLCDEGLGIYCTTTSEVARAAKEDPKPYMKRVREQRHRFTMSYNIGPLKEMYAELKGEKCGK